MKEQRKFPFELTFSCSPSILCIGGRGQRDDEPILEAARLKPRLAPAPLPGHLTTNQWPPGPGRCLEAPLSGDDIIP